MIQKLRQIQPRIGDDLAFCTECYRNVPDGYRFDNFTDSTVLKYKDVLNDYYADYEIVGKTFADFFVKLQLSWARNKKIVEKYIEFANSYYIKFSYNTKNVVTNNTSGNNHSDTNSQHVDVPIDNSDDTPSTKDKDNSDTNYDSDSITISELDDGDIRKVNMLLTNYQSIEDVMISVFDQNFIIFEYYTF